MHASNVILTNAKVDPRSRKIYLQRKFLTKLTEVEAVWKVTNFIYSW